MLEYQYAGNLDFTTSYHDDKTAAGQMQIQDGVLNPFGTVHAGALIWFADVVATTLVLEGREPVKGLQGFPLAINLNANLLGNRQSGTLSATSAYVKRGRRVSTVRTLVRCEQGKTLLELTSTHIAAA